MSTFDPLVDREVEEAFANLSMQVNDLGYDRWGYHPSAAKAYMTLAKYIAKYFRPEVHGIENVPKGRVLIVPNHSGQLPFDALVVAVSMLLEAKPPRLVRSMAERWFPTLPFVNVAFSRAGVVVGDPINCRNLLNAENAILVFPEGAKGSGKPFPKRYQLEKFGRGFMRLALQADSPIVPVGIVGAEESIISLTNIKPLAQLFNTPYAPLPIGLPILGPLAFVPWPTKFHLYFGEPMYFDGHFDDEDEVIERKVQKVVGAVEDLVKKGLAARDGWF